ncbi:replication initiator [Microtetraspora sp. NBRC 13810]|uniref:replication initiator n=1 Tax=Microtetraspora sp. NBRC 13810 TaxID=3030990 RepID=UPI002556F4C0|nr:replication initiator [Microtetraspora sp. NBRC 13810]
MPVALDVAEEIAKVNGVCLQPLEFKRIDTLTGQITLIDVPCGATLESKCAPCAKRNRQLRMVQCREGWHLDHEPVTTPDEPTDEQSWLVEFRADLQAQRDAAETAGQDTADLDAAILAVDDEINAAGIRGNVLGRAVKKRNRSTRRRQDAPDLPRRPMTNTTLGRTFTGNDGKVYRPSMFITLTLPSYGKIRDGAPIDPSAYDYRAAARDALHFSKLVDRFVQNLRRVAGYDVQYFATVEPQKRFAPHLHLAMRGTLPRADVRAVVAATYHQVWWPPADRVLFEGDHLPVWVEREDGTQQAGDYCDPATGEVLPTWDQALDLLDADPDAEPLHVVRFGTQVDVQGILAGSSDADTQIRYLSKYLTKSLGVGSLDPEQATYQARRDHAARLCDALRYEPCSPSCPNWLRYGVQPKGAKPGMVPGRCRSKAHKPDHLGYAGRRVLVSRKWSNKTLAEHRADRRTWVLEALGLDAGQSPPDPHRFIWCPVPAGDPSATPRAKRLLRGVAERFRWRRSMEELQARAEGPPITDLSAMRGAA